MVEKLTWEKMIEIEPRLNELVGEIGKIDDSDEHFCANNVWFGFRGKFQGGGFKRKMKSLAGWYAEKEELQSNRAYDIAYQKLYRLIPLCKHCGC